MARTLMISTGLGEHAIARDHVTGLADARQRVELNRIAVGLPRTGRWTTTLKCPRAGAQHVKKLDSVLFRAHQAHVKQARLAYRAPDGVAISFFHPLPPTAVAALAGTVFFLAKPATGGCCCAVSQRRKFLAIAVPLIPMPQAPITPPTVSTARPAITALEFR
jgi:hypothetical protein